MQEEAYQHEHEGRMKQLVRFQDLEKKRDIFTVAFRELQVSRFFVFVF